MTDLPKGTSSPSISILEAHLFKGPLTIWPVYAYTLAAQNTVIKLLMLILSVENNTSMPCEAIYAKIFVYILSLFSRNLSSSGGGGLNFIKTKDRNFEFFSACSQFLSLVFLFKVVYPTDTCRNHAKITKIV